MCGPDITETQKPNALILRAENGPRSQDNAGSARIFIGLTARRRGPDLIAFNLAEHHLVTLQERAVDFQEENETEGTGNGLQSGARASGSSFAHLCRENSGRGASRPAWGYHRGPKQSPHSDEQRVTPTNAKCPVQMFVWDYAQLSTCGRPHLDGEPAEASVGLGSEAKT